MRFYFNLDWDELDEDLKYEKVVNYLLVQRADDPNVYGPEEVDNELDGESYVEKYYVQGDKEISQMFPFTF